MLQDITIIFNLPKEEKRFFQLELLNRETNFNKIFSSMPNVGVINPLEAGKVFDLSLSVNLYFTFFMTLCVLTTYFR